MFTLTLQLSLSLSYPTISLAHSLIYGKTNIALQLRLKTYRQQQKKYIYKNINDNEMKMKMLQPKDEHFVVLFCFGCGIDIVD